MLGHKDQWYWEGTGDARRCPTHPHVRTSSPCGMFDAPCGQCEAQMAAVEVQAEWEALPPEEKQAIIEANEAREREQENKYLDDDIPF